MHCRHHCSRKPTGTTGIRTGRPKPTPAPNPRRQHLSLRCSLTFSQARPRGPQEVCASSEMCAQETCLKWQSVDVASYRSGVEGSRAWMRRCGRRIYAVHMHAVCQQGECLFKCEGLMPCNLGMGAEEEPPALSGGQGVLPQHDACMLCHLAGAGMTHSDCITLMGALLSCRCDCHSSGVQSRCHY